MKWDYVRECYCRSWILRIKYVLVNVYAFKCYRGRAYYVISNHRAFPSSILEMKWENLKEAFEKAEKLIKLLE